MNSSPKIKTIYLRQVLSGMLLFLKTEDILSFLKRRPLYASGKPVPVPQLLRYIWSEKFELDIEYHTQFLFDLEKFILDRGLSMNEFIRIYQEYNNGSNYSSNWILSFVGAKLRSFFIVRDLRPFLLRLTRTTTALTFKRCSARYLDHKIANGWHTGTLAWWINDFDSEHLRYWDMNIWNWYTIKYVPCLFALPPYEHMRLLADARTPEMVLYSYQADTSYGWKGNRFYIEGKPMARKRNFHEFCLQNKIQAIKKVPDRIGAYMEKDFVCPVRKRVVLAKDTFYGSPVGLVFLRYRTMTTVGSTTMEEVIQDALHLTRPQRPEVEQAFKKLLAAAESRREHSLSDRELEILELLMRGHTYSDISKALGIQLGTVQTYVKRVYEKLEVSSKAEAVWVAVQKNILQPASSRND